MRVLDVVRGWFGRKQVEEEGPLSIVLLFRSPFSLTEELLAAAATRAYGVPYDGSDKMHFIVQNPAVTIVKAGAYAMLITQVSRPYLGDPIEISRQFSDPSAANAWSEHRAFATLDLMNKQTDQDAAYSFLAALAAELLDVRCTGIYLPRPSYFWPQSDGTAEDKLRRLKVGED